MADSDIRAVLDRSLCYIVDLGYQHPVLELYDAISQMVVTVVVADDDDSFAARLKIGSSRL